ncbi:Aste57867_8130 [Aphanomyces stellatus]|uniref:Aste57867_8130 protein n=1 Tax=Aphanomyces stellatus TaxID=120398 RepID=A0A485KJH2_9STRA|nr:hypothetical protein As57867_008100 [Aphanomyces stellatus]VFT85019.1 Aste57867_8130 [Aphanomyces stellatus]
MQVIRFLAVTVVATASAQHECTSTDMGPMLNSGLACIKAANLDMNALLGRDPATLGVMCKHSECKTFFANSTQLACTVQGQPAALAAKACSSAHMTTLPALVLALSTAFAILIVL